MLGTYLVYREERARAKAQVQSKRRPVWLRAFSALRSASEGKSADETFDTAGKVTAELSTVKAADKSIPSKYSIEKEIIDLFPEHLKKKAPSTSPQSQDTDGKSDPKSCWNRCALFVRASITERAWFEALVMIAVLMVAVVTGK